MGSAEFAKTLPTVPTIVLPIEKNIPFIPLMILPYMASSYFFWIVFFWVKNRQQLTLLRDRMLFIVTIAGLVFIVFPLKQSFYRPESENIIFKLLFRLLSLADSPFNQAPSLHVALCILHGRLVLWRFIGIVRYLLLALLALIAISTPLVYQHHSIDVVTGAALGFLSLLIFREKKMKVS